MSLPPADSGDLHSTRAAAWGRTIRRPPLLRSLPCRQSPGAASGRVSPLPACSSPSSSASTCSASISTSPGTTSAQPRILRAASPRPSARHRRILRRLSGDDRPVGAWLGRPAQHLGRRTVRPLDRHRRRGGQRQPRRDSRLWSSRATSSAISCNGTSAPASPRQRGIERDGPYYLFTLRLVPLLPFFAVNLCIGLTRIRVWTYFWVTLLGMVPASFFYVNAGRELARIDSPSDALVCQP